MIEIPDPSLSYREYPGPVLLLAGPGTGKTWQLAMRAKFLIEEQGVEPSEVAIITFTNEAARNMQAQFTKEGTKLAEDKQPHFIGTMHSLGNKILGSCPERFGLPTEYKVLERNDRPMLLADAAILSEQEEGAAKESDRCRGEGACDPGSRGTACEVCKAYLGILRKCGRVDFDDLIYLACDALEKDADLRQIWQAKAMNLLVDEYQDINHAQWNMIRLLSSESPQGLFAVGDDDQSIYSFRGGTPAFIKDFGEHFGEGAKIGRLAKSWRCPEHILQAARAVIRAHYPGSVAKPAPQFEEAMANSGAVIFHDLPSDTWEANAVAAISREKIQMGSVLVLIPHAKYWPPVRDALRKRGLAYSYTKGPVPTFLSCLATVSDWAENPADSVLTRRLLERVVSAHDEWVSKIGETGSLSEKRGKARAALARIWGEVGEGSGLYRVLETHSGGEGGEPFYTELVTALNEVRDLLMKKGKNRAALTRFLECCGRLVAPGKHPEALIEEVRQLQLDGTSDGGAGNGRLVQVFNLPSSKGLQGDVVLVIGLSEGLFPPPDQDEEEAARLLYVAMTRAKQELHLFSSRKRPANITFKENSFQLRRSRFIDAIPNEHISKTWIAAPKAGKAKGF